MSRHRHTRPTGARGPKRSGSVRARSRRVLSLGRRRKGVGRAAARTTPARTSARPGLSAKTKAKAKKPPASALTRRNRIPVALAAVFALAVLGTSFPASALISQHRQLSSTSAQLREVQAANHALSEQEQQLNSTADIERLARQDYQLVLPGQTLYDVLPPSGQTVATAPGDPTSGDPGTQPLVEPADAPDMSPDPALAAVPSPSTSTSSAPGATSGSPTGTASPGGFWSRVTHTLEFWN